MKYTMFCWLNEEELLGLLVLTSGVVSAIGSYPVTVS